MEQTGSCEAANPLRLLESKGLARRSNRCFPPYPRNNISWTASRVARLQFGLNSMHQTERNAWLAKEILVHERALRRYLSRFFRNMADIDDAVQETYARLLGLSESAFGAVRNWQAFLFTSARNVTLDRIRKSRVVSYDALAEIETLHVLDQQPSADEALNARQELALL